MNTQNTMANKISLVLTLLGRDQPGLVEKVSSRVTAAGGNWLESHLSRMSGFFGGMVHLRVPADGADSLVRSLEKLADEGIQIAMERTVEEAARPARMGRLEVVGHDQPGIVKSISEALAARDVNVEELFSSCESAPMAGHEMFKAHARVSLPDNLSVADLRQDLEAIAADLLVDLTIEKEEQS